MNLVLRKKEIEDRLNEIRGMIDKETDMTKLEEMEKETDKLQEERMMIEKKMNLNKMTEIPVVSIKNNADSKDILEKRGMDLMENRTIKVSSEEILLPEHVDTNLAPYPFKPYSELVDRVHTINLNGGETYTKSFVKSYGVAGNTAEGASYTETEPTYGYVTIPKVKVTAYTEITEELEKLPAINYQAEVLKNINISLRKKISEQILKGDGSTNNFTGIFSAKADALKDNKKTLLTISSLPMAVRKPSKTARASSSTKTTLGHLLSLERLKEERSIASIMSIRPLTASLISLTATAQH